MKWSDLKKYVQENNITDSWDVCVKGECLVFTVNPEFIVPVNDLGDLNQELELQTEFPDKPDDTYNMIHAAIQNGETYKSIREKYHVNTSMIATMKRNMGLL